jgi:hypothetical protein
VTARHRGDGVGLGVVDTDDGIETDEVEHLLDAGDTLKEVKRASFGAKATGRSQERAEPAAVHEPDARHVDEEMAMTGGDETDDGLFEERGGINIDFPGDFEDGEPVHVAYQRFQSETFHDSLLSTHVVSWELYPLLGSY